MTFLPEDDQDYLRDKGITYELKTETVPQGAVRNGLVIPSFEFEGALQVANEGKMVPCNSCDLLIVIPSGYETTRLDSFYTRPYLSRVGGGPPLNANVRQTLFDLEWQFWSRHLTDNEWKMGSRGLDTYLQYVRDALRSA